MKSITRNTFSSLLLIGLFLAACTTPGIQPQAPDTLSVAIKLGKINDGNAHVYAFLGTMHAVFDTSVASPANFFVNGKNIGGINKGECMFIELLPGTYKFSWQERALSSPVMASPVAFKIAASQNVFVAFDFKAGAGAMFGAIGALAEGVTGSVVNRSGDGFQTIQNMKIVLPDESAVGMLRPM